MNSPPCLSVIFMGTAELARPSLAALAESGSYQVSAVVTQPDRPKGRQLQLQPSPVKVEATARGLRVLQPERARDPEFIKELAALAPDLIVVVAYGQILRRAVLELPRYGCVNVHASLLPRYRGAAPIQWAILDGQPETGITIMRMDEGLDTGDILTQRSVPIRADDTALTIHDRLAEVGSKLLVETLPGYTAGDIIPKKQNEAKASYARKITKEDGRIDWSQSAVALWNRVRALVPWPGTYCLLPTPKGGLLKIWDAEVVETEEGAPGEILEANRSGIVVATGCHALRIKIVQREGGKRMDAGAFLAGCPLHAGQRLEI